MARKQITTIHLERQAHRDAKQRLRLAYIYLIEKSQAIQQPIDEKERRRQPQEVKS